MIKTVSMSYFYLLTKGTTADRLNFLFDVYDQDGKHELFLPVDEGNYSRLNFLFDVHDQDGNHELFLPMGEKNQSRLNFLFDVYDQDGKHELFLPVNYCLFAIY